MRELEEGENGHLIEVVSEHICVFSILGMSTYEMWRMDPVIKRYEACEICNKYKTTLTLNH